MAIATVLLIAAIGSVSADHACVANDGSGDAYFCGDTVLKSCTLNGTMTCTDNTKNGLVVGADGITIDGNGYAIIGPGCGDTTISGIKNVGYDNVIIKNLEITGFCNGIFLYGGWDPDEGKCSGDVENNTIYNCTVHDNGGTHKKAFGISLKACVCNSTIKNCAVYNQIGKIEGSCEDGGAGIRLHSMCNHNNIICNNVYNNSLAGIYSKMICKYNYVAYNKVTGNGFGGGNSFPGGIRLQCKKTNNWTVEYNNVTDNYGPGIFVRGDNATIRYNTVINSTNVSTKYGDGIHIWGSTMDWSTGNTIYDNTACENKRYDIFVNTPEGAEASGDNNTCDNCKNYNDEGETCCTYTCDNLLSVYYDFDNDGDCSKKAEDCSCGAGSCCNPGLFNSSGLPEHCYGVCNTTAGNDPDDCNKDVYGTPKIGPLQAPPPPEPNATVYLVPEDSSAAHCNEVEVEIWVNTSEDIAGGQINLTYNPDCANVTNFVRDAAWELGGWDSRVEGREWITFTSATPKTGEVLIGTLTIHCVNESYCTTALVFDEDSGLSSPPPAHWIETAWEDGTFVCANMPDLVITEVRGVPTPGNTTNYTVEYTVENVGNVNATEFWVNLTVDGAQLTTEYVSGLNAGATYSGNFSGYVVSLTGNIDNITVCADYNNTVTPELNESNNCGSGRYPAGARIMVIPADTIVQPQDQFEVSITIDSFGSPVHSVQYYLTYNTSVLRAETQVKGPFLGNHSETIVEWNNIDQANGIVSYAETRKGADGRVGDGTVPGSTVATIQFTAIGPRNATTNLSLYDVVIVMPDLNKLEPVYTVNGTATINRNRPPVAIGTSKHRHNNVAKKYPCNTIICSCSWDPDFGDKGGNISYIRFAFGDGQYGTTEGLPVNNCTCKEHKYESWRWEPIGNPDGHYLPFEVQLTVTDDGCPELTNTTNFSVNVYIAGDANGDGEVNIIDAAYVGRYWLEKCNESVPPEELWCNPCNGYLWTGADADKKDRADLNNDCEINILDAALVGANWRHTAW